MENDDKSLIVDTSKESEKRVVETEHVTWPAEERLKQIFGEDVFASTKNRKTNKQRLM